MAATLAQVAALAGVSPQTVSNAISNPSIVKDATLTRVQAAIAELGYTPNVRARMLRQQRTGNIGLRMRPTNDNVAGVLIDRLLHELSAQAAPYDKHVLLLSAATDEEEVRTIEQMAAQSLVDEFVLTDTHPEDHRIEDLSARGLRFVAFGRPWGSEDTAPHSWVDVDGRSGTAEATLALIELGFRRIGFFGWPAGSATGDDRRGGWADVVKTELGYTDDDLAALSAESEDHISSAIDAAPALLAAGAEAVVCASDSLAVGMVAAIRTSGATVPIVGFDNTPLAASFGFASVDQDLARVAQHILAALDTPEETHRGLLPPRLIVRHDPRWGFPTAPNRATPRN
ncbi:MAG: LacI family DNA-binding transcriptional regulator [Arachnia sp.]